MFLTQEQIQQIGFKSIGENVLISDKASIYNTHNIELGSHVRIDDFSILSAGNIGIQIGSHVHIAPHASLIGDIILEDGVGISHKCTLLSASDDFSGEYHSNPTYPIEKRKINSGRIIVKENSVIGAHTVILPRVIIGINSCVGAGSVVKYHVESNSIHAGTPAKFIGERKKNKFV